MISIVAKSPASLLADIETVDGSGSGFDADLLDGLEATAFELAGTAASAASAVQTSLNTHTAATGTSVHGLGTASTRNVGTGSGNLPLLDTNGKLSITVLPGVALTDTFVVNTQAAMLALAAQTGDVAVRTDLSETFILKGSDPAILGNWQQLLSPTSPVQSVNGATGAVTLTTTNIAEGTNLYFTDARAIDAVDLSGLLPLSGGTITGDLTVDGTLSTGTAAAYATATLLFPSNWTDPFNVPSLDGEGFTLDDGNGTVIAYNFTSTPAVANDFNFDPSGGAFLSDVINGSGIGITASFDNVNVITLTNNVAGSAGNTLVDGDIEDISINGVYFGDAAPRFSGGYDAGAKFIVDTTGTITGLTGITTNRQTTINLYWFDPINGDQFGTLTNCNITSCQSITTDAISAATIKDEDGNTLMSLGSSQIDTGNNILKAIVMAAETINDTSGNQIMYMQHDSGRLSFDVSLTGGGFWNIGTDGSANFANGNFVLTTDGDLSAESVTSSKFVLSVAGADSPVEGSLRMFSLDDTEVLCIYMNGQWNQITTTFIDLGA